MTLVELKKLTRAYEEKLQEIKAAKELLEGLDPAPWTEEAVKPIELSVIIMNIFVQCPSQVAAKLVFDHVGKLEAQRKELATKIGIGEDDAEERN